VSESGEYCLYSTGEFSALAGLGEVGFLSGEIEVEKAPDQADNKYRDSQL
jgi:hypothetical protein